MENKFLEKEIINLLNYGLIQATHSNKLIFKYEFDENEDLDQKNSTLACGLAYLAESHSLFLNAKNLILSNQISKFDITDLQKIFDQFNTFNNTTLDNLEQNHPNDQGFREFINFVDECEKLDELFNKKLINLARQQ
ncbi:hypothetical protein [Enterococcus faecium]|uniref:hypothetical protein n=1 Tax=Enterococcus faecium TaxID=1352 RepID=UPI0011168B5A|nr:hypothetical protein [Enterococcus faecium]QDA52827.1 hypothetical protein FHJ99_11730 [Enterococcus faecium]